MTELLALLQFADGLFPSGGFAHSFGLETYTQDGRIRDRAGLEQFVIAHLEGSAGPCDAVAVALAAAAAVDRVRAGAGVAANAGHGGLAGWLEIDARLEATKCVPEVRAASRQMGRQTVRVAAAISTDAGVGALASAVEDGATAGHHAMVFGAVTGRAGICPRDAAAAFLYSTAVLLVNAGLRLLPLGQLDGQRTLARVRPQVAELARRAVSVVWREDGERRGDALDALWSFTPGLERAGLVHARLERRLFRS
jgi:urease accessory protein